MKIQAAVVSEQAGAIQHTEAELDEPKTGEVRVKIAAAGICHTDLGVQQQEIPTPLPIALGHEGAGVVEKVGDGVQDVAPGDHVVITFSHCGTCRNCREGHPGACENFNALNFGGTMNDGTRRLHSGDSEVSSLFGQGSLATYAVTPVNNVVKVSRDVDIRLLGPLACGVQTGAGTVLSRLNLGVGDTIVVFGCGGVGMSAVMAAHLAGALQVIAVDVNEERLETAKELGATHTINGKNEDVVEKVKEWTNGGADYALESTGVAALAKKAMDVLRYKGESAVVGAGADTEFHVHQNFIVPNATMSGVVEGDVVPKLFIPMLVEYYKQGKFPFDKLVTMYPFEELEQALEDMKAGKTIKPVITFE